MSFETTLAWRHLKSGGSQTALTVGAVGIAVTVVVFINALITGVQQRIINDMIGSIPHITLTTLDTEPKPLQRVARDQSLVAAHIDRQFSQRKLIEDVDTLTSLVKQYPGVQVVVPAAQGQVFFSKGSRQFGVRITGSDPNLYDQIIKLHEDMVAGEWLHLGPDDIVVGNQLLKDSGVKLGGFVHVQSPEGVEATLRIAGVFDTGQTQVDSSTAYVTLRTAQRLFRAQGSVTSIMVRLNDPWQADKVSSQLGPTYRLKSESWMTTLAIFVNGIRAQNGSRAMISAFALIASAFSITAILIVSVIRRSKQIGILKSIGATDGQILRVFALEGLGIGIAGALVGAGLGALLLTWVGSIRQVARVGKIDQLFPVVHDPVVYGIAMGSGVFFTVLAALLPARRAAKLDPVEVLRGG